MLGQQARDLGCDASSACMRQDEVPDLHDPPLGIEVVKSPSADDLAGLRVGGGEREQATLLGEQRHCFEGGSELVPTEGRQVSGFSKLRIGERGQDRVDIVERWKAEDDATRANAVRRNRKARAHGYASTSGTAGLYPRSMVQIISQDELPLSNIAREFVGAEHGGVGVCVIFVDAPPGTGPNLHKHPYEELFIVLEGEVTFSAEDGEAQAGPGDVVVVPADTPHAFTNTGEGRLRQIDIHVSPEFSTEWL